MDGTDFDKEPERYYDWMLWKLKKIVRFSKVLKEYNKR